MKTIAVPGDAAMPESAKKADGPSRERIRKDKFSTLHLPCFLSDLNKTDKS